MEPYEELGVAPTATVAEIRAAYVGLARRFHPDQNSDDETRGDIGRMARINAAWTLLSDERRRAAYDTARFGERESRRNGATVRDAGDTWTPLDDDDLDPTLLDDTSSGARPLPRIVALLPPSLLVIGVFLVMFGLIVKVPPTVGLGVVLIVASGAAFLAIPVATMVSASRSERDW